MKSLVQVDVVLVSDRVYAFRDGMYEITGYVSDWVLRGRLFRPTD